MMKTADRAEVLPWDQLQLPAKKNLLILRMRENCPLLSATVSPI
jgi:hypothetical protein